MAGYTSRIFLTLTLPSVFGFLSVLWFLKKRNSSKQINKAIQVEDTTSIEERQYLALNSMKLKNQEGSSSEEQISCSEMQLKETLTSTEKQPEYTNGVSHQKSKGKKKGKVKLLENGTTCMPKESITNGCVKSNSEEDSQERITNGVKALSLSENGAANGDEIFAQVNKACAEMDNHFTPILLNGSAEKDSNSDSQSCTVESLSETSNLSNSDNESVSQEEKEEYIETAKQKCDTDCLQISNDTNSSLTVEGNVKQTEVVADIRTVDNTQTSTNELLTLPVDCPVNDVSGDMLESPGAKYCDSVGSNDSGKGGSEFQFMLEPQQMCMVYEFEILQELCGLLIGRNGRHVNYIKEETNANILIKRHPYFNDKKICSITGTDDEIHAALKLIRKRFPVEVYPTVTLSQINSLPINLQLPETLKLCLPEGVSFEAMLCATVNAGHFFLQQPTHPTFHSLPALTAQMTALYSQIETPALTHLAKGYVCAANLTDGWFRAEIDHVYDNDECRLKFLDYGGYTVVPRSALRQIRFDFMNVPFQATECYLGSITFPEGETGWSVETTAVFEELAQGQIVQGYIVGYAENRVPYVHLYKITGATSIFINRELVSRNLARWIANPH
ncbi:KH domain-containing protein akap-1-like [Uloborus diversus]|uniref:KH domain-containing protein akap-1-like n=1 Tax=Uloborus diversus TaxID=327109 RepID=UPI00240A36DA|nr:KH domain-containing protein akap-1-like [Uloborus diversus]